VPQKALRSPQILKPQLQGGISAMVSSAEMALREGKKPKELEAARVFGSHRLSLSFL
jgi:hypothetical protein